MNTTKTTKASKEEITLPTELSPSVLTNLLSADEEQRRAAFSTQEEFLRATNGRRFIKKILVANNGIAAVKCMRSIRSWAYGTFRNADAFFFVCMASPEDVHANAEYIKIANKMVMVPGGSNINNYANVELILQTAVANHVDAVWAGWGHASENPQLPEVLAKHNIAFLGPTHDAMWALGDKIASTILAQSAGIPTVPWSGSNILVNTDKFTADNPDDPFSISRVSFTIGNSLCQDLRRDQSSPSFIGSNRSRTTASQIISQEDFANSCVINAEQCQAVSNEIGYPVMIKASEGGGGKGIRRATHSNEVPGLFTQVQNEVPESPIFVMKCMERVRHLEVQILADQYGEAISLFGRDCSVQRRHQKILEEAPVIVAPQHVFDAMEKAAIHLAKLVGYTSAGTVEYLYKPETQEFFFLELNPRLQVEHPCTEVISGVNLPACQLQIAMGIPLIRIKDVRNLFGLSTSSDFKISLSSNLNLRRPPSSHVIAVRITSEDPDEGFKPRSGDVLELNFKSSRSVWGYFSVGTVGGIHEFADSQFGHCFSAEISREQARENMVLALRELLIRGDFRTTVEYLIKILESDKYISNEMDTEWIDRLIAQKDRPERPDICLGVMCTALHIAFKSFEEACQNFEVHFERGQFLPTNELSNSLDVTLISDGVKYVVKVVRTGKISFHLITNGGLQAAEVHRMSGGGLLITHESSTYMTYCREDAQGYQTVIDNRTVVFSKEWDLSLLRSPSTGKLVQFTVADGSHIFENEVYALVEVMKLVLELRSPASGCIFFLRCSGAILEPGAPIARLQLDDAQKCPTLQLFTGQLIPIHSTTLDVFTMSETGAVSSSGYDDLSILHGLSANEESENDALSIDDGLVMPGVQHLSTLLPTNNRHRVFSRCVSEFEEVLDGYALPDPFLSDWLEKRLDILFQCLRDPQLPLLQLQDTIAQLSCRLPSSVDESLCELAASYSNQVTSMMSNFPSDKIARLIDGYITARRLENQHEPNVMEASINAFQQTVKPLLDLADRYRNGIRGHASRVIVNLLLAYVAVEQHYQHGQFDRCVNLLLTRQKVSTSDPNSKEAVSILPTGTRRKTADTLPLVSWPLSDSIQRLADPTSVADVVAVHFSHHHLSAKNALIVGLIERLAQQCDISLTRDLIDSLNALTQLGMACNSKVALAARKFLISAQSPPYELRRNQIESIVLSAISSYGDQFPMESLQNIIASETAVFDILADLLYHQNPLIVSVVLEIYVRRSYMNYELTGLQNFKLNPGISCVFFKFLLPQTSIQIDFWRHVLNSRNQFSSDSIANSASLSDMSECGHSNEIDGELDWYLPIEYKGAVNSDLNNRLLNGSQLLSSLSLDSEQVSKDVSRSISDAANIEKCASSVYLKSVTSTERLGAIAVFKSFAEFRSSFNTLIARFQHKLKLIEMEKRSGGRRQNSFSATQSNRNQSCLNLSSESYVAFQDPPFKTTSTVDVPANVLNICIRRSRADYAINSSGDFCNDVDGSTPRTEGLYLLDDDSNEEADVHVLEQFCLENNSLLRTVGIRRITFMLVLPSKFPHFFTFRARDNFQEDRVYRHSEPALAFQMEINRLRNYDLERLPVLNRRMNMYLGQAKIPQGQGAVDFRFFVRCTIRHADLVSKAASFEYLRSEAERTLLESMDALEMAFSHPKAKFTTGNHIFLNFAPTLFLPDIRQLHMTVRTTILRYATRLLKLRVKQAELKLLIRHSQNGPRIPIRLFVSHDQGYDLKLDIYRELPNLDTGSVHLVSYGSRSGRLNGHLVNEPYETKDFLQLKRFQAQKFSSSYVYDYPSLLGQVMDDIWDKYNRSSVSFTLDESYASTIAEKISLQHDDPSMSTTEQKTDLPRSSSNNYILDCRELCLDENGHLITVSRPPGINKIGMVAWQITFKTPEYPEGRPIILISNDVTHKAGSFGPSEDLLFFRASELARRLGIPRVYLAANSGARIRLSDEVKSVFKVAWVDAKQPDKGFRYLYLTKADYLQLAAIQAVNCELVNEDGEDRYKLVDIIGKDFDISVENLRGSALIAGETSTAYDECFTISVVTSRTIGIGAYLVRLGQRVIQVDNSHIILTGAMALNKLLSRDVYTSNSQLGGVQVMANNGVCHLVVPDEYCAMKKVVNWLSFVPYKRGARLPILRQPIPLAILSKNPVVVTDKPEKNSPTIAGASSTTQTFDPVDRLVDYFPTRQRSNDDPRWMFTGVFKSRLQTISTISSEDISGHERQDKWLSGFFDWGTWQESLSAWAAGVIVGRARLGGIPCGIITPETRVSVSMVPADPANPSSEAQTISQAGQVWYPDSSYKTAQAIADFAREELPLFIFANWRGFSGGLKDMYDQVLKFGAMIVESLRSYRNPVFVYLPPQAELRGGAWVVIDPAINPDHMEIFCTPDTCRGGVLEPEGTVEIKYRTPDILLTINRLDDECCRLNAEIKSRLVSSRQVATSSQEAKTFQTLSTSISENIIHSASSPEVSLSNSSIKHLQNKLATRQQMLLPIYQQVAHRFADLHDTPGRMVARGLVHGTVDWHASRAFFFVRLSRRLLEQEAVQLIRHFESPFMNSNDSYSLSFQGRVSFDKRYSSLDFDHIFVSAKPSLLRSDESVECPIPENRVGENSDFVFGSKVDDNINFPDYLSDPQRACSFISEIGAQRSSSIRRELTRLRNWFVENTATPTDIYIEPTHKENVVTRSVDPCSALLDSVNIWDTSDATVARWLSVQLEHKQLFNLLNQFSPPYLENGCWILKSSNNSTSIIENIEKSVLLPRLKDMSKNQTVNHIRRLLKAHPECIFDVREYIESLNTVNLSIDDPHSSLVDHSDDGV